MKEIDKIAKAFLKHYRSPEYSGRSWKQSYFSLRNFLKKRDEVELKSLYNYANQLSEVVQGDLAKFFYDSEVFRKKQLNDREEELRQSLNVKQYKEYGYEDILKL